MPINPKFLKLLISLDGATSEGRIEWSETLGNEFRADLDGAAVRVGHVSGDESGKPFYYANLINDKSILVEEVYSGEEESPMVDQTLISLYETAKRTALKVDDLIDNLINKVNARHSVRKN